MIRPMYKVQKVSTSGFVKVRTHDYHVRIWGEARPGVAPLVLVHGWMDVSASWQFMVDALAGDRQVIAPDWRGYGLTTGPATDNYWMADYLADLDCLLDHYAGAQAVDLVGHSMGGNVAMLYAGVRPERIRRLVNLEGFGLAATRPDQVGQRYARWIDELKTLHRGESALHDYEDAAGVARRLRKNNPRLDADRADWLATHWAAQQPNGRWKILGDSAHKIIGANLYQVDETLALYRCITAPTLMVEASDNSLDKWWDGKFTLAEFHERIKAVPNLQTAHLEDASHMLHHDQPQLLAQRVERFLAGEDDVAA